MLVKQCSGKQKLFYSLAVYHATLAPTPTSDANAKYMPGPPELAACVPGRGGKGGLSMRLSSLRDLSCRDEKHIS